MKIAQVSPLNESVPPKKYGGIERIVSYLTEELVNLGHDVTLFATSDSETKAELVSPGCSSLRVNNYVDNFSYQYLMLELIEKEIHNFDIIHFHLDLIHYPFCRRNNLTHITTMHGRLDLPELIPSYIEFKELPVVSISNSQKLPIPEINWKKTIYNGLPENQYQFHSDAGTYFAFIGRISPEKGPEVAIELCHSAGVPLKLAAKVDPVDVVYHESVIKPLLEKTNIEFIGEINDFEKNDFLGNAKALIFPINWPEPFGLVMIEAMACGTPVIAWDRGSVSEIIEHGVNGFIVNSMNEALDAIKNISQLDRKMVRKTFESRFTAKRMTNEYLKLYEEMVLSRK